MTVLREGGHIAEVFDVRSGINPLWAPPWPSVDPSLCDLSTNLAYGKGSDAKLLAGVRGHSLCLDVFGDPSPAEAIVGLTTHGEGSVIPYEIVDEGMALTLRTDLHLAPLHFERRIELRGTAVRIAELVKNLSSSDRPIAWTQHVTLGPPFLEKGSTEFRSSMTRSKVYEQEFGSRAYLKAGEEFDWPMAPRRDGGYADLRVMNDSPASSAFTAHLADLGRDTAFFVAFSPSHRLALGYVWKSADFPWMGIWEENCSRLQLPWNGRALARGMEFGVSPFPESRRQMIERGRLFDIPTYRWIPAKGILKVEYWIVLQSANSVPESLSWPG